mmetsp:Transcript_20733/g.50699  ORF Transcript_20733/g.50699 Transcript_20733/m.50699 type:complete len:152 (-) Transcript_20733:186-641(-)
MAVAFGAAVGGAVWGARGFRAAACVIDGRRAVTSVPTAFMTAGWRPTFVHRWPGRTGMASATGGPEGEDTVVAGAKRKLMEEFKPTKLDVIPAYDDPNGSHVAIRVTSEAFEGKNTVQRHRMVYKTLWEELQGPIHAVDELITKTPAEDTS